MKEDLVRENLEGSFLHVVLTLIPPSLSPCLDPPYFCSLGLLTEGASRLATHAWGSLWALRSVAPLVSRKVEAGSVKSAGLHRPSCEHLLAGRPRRVGKSRR